MMMHRVTHERNVTAIIPARGGSKGLPRKNLACLGHHPLIAWTIRAALASNRVNRVIVSSEDEEILTVAYQYGAEALARPRDLADDFTSSEQVLLHALDVLRSEGSTPDTCVFVQPTSPLRTDVDIDEALDLQVDRQADAVISVYEPRHTPFKAFFEAPDGALRPVAGHGMPFVPRQSLPRAFMPNGAIYVIETETFCARRQFMGDHTVAYVMPEERSIDIDDAEDLRQAEQVISGLGLSLPRVVYTTSIAAQAARESVAALEFLEEEPEDLLEPGLAKVAGGQR